MEAIQPRRLHYDFALRLGVAYYPVGVEPEMAPTVDLFKRLDDACRQVHIVCGDVKVLAYVLRDGHWFTGSLTT